MASNPVGGQPLPDDVWEAARFIWENTPTISDRELVDLLAQNFGQDAPKSGGTISKRRSKDAKNDNEWLKRSLVIPSKKKAVKGVKNNEKQESSERNQSKNRNQSGVKNTLIPPKTNKAQNMESVGIQESANGKLEEIIDNVVMSAKQRAAIIVKHRKRWKKQGDIQDNVVSLSLSLLDDLDNPDADPETIQKKIAVINILANALDVTTRASKTISEVELPLCGITPEDFKQSDQERRLGALEALGDIHIEEQEARERLEAELNDRLEWIKETANSGDFGRTPEPDDDDVEDIDYTAVDD